jgi:hypothetical protein
MAVQDPVGRLPSWEYPRATASLAALLIDERRYAEAEPLALRVLAVRDSAADTLARQALAQLVKLYQGWGKEDRAEEYRRRLQ